MKKGKTFSLQRSVEIRTRFVSDGLLPPAFVGRHWSYSHPFFRRVPSLPSTGSLIAKIAFIYDHTLSKEDAATFIVQLLSSGAGRQIFRYMLLGSKSGRCYSWCRLAS